MDELALLKVILKKSKLKWLPKHLNHIAEHIKLDDRNVSFLAINALFRSSDYILVKSPPPFENHYIISGYVAVQKNDLLRTKAEYLTAVFYLDNHNNIVPITAYSESDEK